MRTASAAALLLLAGCRSEAPGPACPHDPAFDRSRVIQVRADDRPAVVRRDLGLAEIAGESAGSAGAGRTQGLTVVDNQLAFRTLVRTERASGRSCVWFDRVEVDLTPRSAQIFVPREYPEGSCEDQAVLAHEREHERVHRERLAAAVKDVEQALTQARWLPARGNPLEAEDGPSAQAALEAKIRKVVTPVYERYKADLSSAQADLDRPDLYRWVSKRCSGWK